jgi:hypothetical protein
VVPGDGARRDARAAPELSCLVVPECADDADLRAKVEDLLRSQPRPPILADAGFGASYKRRALEASVEVLTTLGKRAEAAPLQAQLDSLSRK